MISQWREVTGGQLKYKTRATALLPEASGLVLLFAVLESPKFSEVANLDEKAFSDLVREDPACHRGPEDASYKRTALNGPCRFESVHWQASSYRVFALACSSCKT